MDILINIIKRGASEFGLNIPDSALRVFEKYYTYLTDRNKNMNLTAISGEEDVARLHFLDSLYLLMVDDLANKKIIDIGSGAGFPGLPLKIVNGDIDLTLLDSQRKRVDFLKDLVDNLEIPGIDLICARAEEIGVLKEQREKYDVAVSRAVAELNVLCELCLPLVKRGGIFVAMKSAGSDSEISDALNAVNILGGALENVMDYNIPETEIIHRAVVIRKVSETVPKYPRRFARIKKSPL